MVVEVSRTEAAHLAVGAAVDPSSSSSSTLLPRQQHGLAESVDDAVRVMRHHVRPCIKGRHAQQRREGSVGVVDGDEGRGVGPPHPGDVR
eukprot:scaffold1503_cov150-Ochromonas_danica.AAC.24